MILPLVTVPNQHQPDSAWVNTLGDVQQGREYEAINVFVLAGVYNRLALLSL